MEPDINGNSCKEPEYLSHDITGMKLEETKIPEGREACIGNRSTSPLNQLAKML